MKDPTVMTAAFWGLTLRDTIVCKLLISWEPIIVGSRHLSGAEA